MVDRTILRLAVAELLEVPESPTAVVLDEAVGAVLRVLDRRVRSIRERRAGHGGVRACGATRSDAASDEGTRMQECEPAV